MPYLQIQTNLEIKPEQHATLLANASQTVAQILGKPESYVMVALQANTPMVFAGTDQPTAFLELKSIRLPTANTTELSQKLCAFIENSLNIPKDRIYIEFINAEASLWGWNGRTF
jgi:phenylpyruvate tautomerase PptA (4-oxalocrotonate tautomerase family)